MSDVYATIADANLELQERLADVIEQRSTAPGHQAMVREYLSEIVFPDGAEVVEIGCGTGAIIRTVAQWPGVGHAVGIDPSPVFISRARQQARDIPNLNFQQGDGRSLTLADESFDIAIIHTTLSHVPHPERLLAEAFRIIRRGGWLALFDGDYATATVASGDHDPLQACVHAFRQNYINDPWIMRRVLKLLAPIGFDSMPARSFGYVEAPEASYMLTWIDRGADALVESAQISTSAADALKSEARRRSADKKWYGFIAFTSVLSRKPM